MRYLFTVLMFNLVNFLMLGQSVSNEDLVMCSGIAVEEVGRCTGKVNCTVCSDCSRCGYCNSGGSCGVCSGRSSSSYDSRNFYSSSTQKARITTSPDGLMADEPYSIYYLRTLYVVGTDNLNLRAGPSTKYRIIQKLPRLTKLYFWAMNDGWVKVTVQKSDVVGYVYHTYVAVE
jgi:hypothetical protein